MTRWTYPHGGRHDPARRPATPRYLEDLTNPAIFDPAIQHARSGSVTVAVFELADGRRVATGVYCGVSGCVPLTSYPH